MEQELKGCPFCGSEAKVYLGQYACAYVVCLCCGLTAPTANSRDEAIERWNKRPVEWRCFSCEFVTNDPAEALAHFGDRDDAEEFKPICKWWANMDEHERLETLQDTVRQLNNGAEENMRLLDKIEELEAARAGEKALTEALELSEILVGIREQTSRIIMHSCSEKCGPDNARGDPGVPPCPWAEIEKEQYCDNCKITEEARQKRRQLRIRKNILVRKIAARAALAARRG